MSAARVTGRLDRLGSLGRALRAVTGPVRGAAGRAALGVRVGLREPAALRAAARAGLLSRAAGLAADPAVPAAVGAEAALAAWLAEQTPRTEALLIRMQGLREASPAVEVDPRLADLPADQAQQLTAVLAATGPGPGR